MLMYESASISVTFFSNMAAYRGGFEDEDDEYSCMSCLDTTKYRCLVVNFHCVTNAHFHEKTTKLQVGKLESLLRFVCLARKKPSNKAHSTQYSVLGIRGGIFISKRRMIIAVTFPI